MILGIAMAWRRLPDVRGQSWSIATVCAIGVALAMPFLTSTNFGLVQGYYKLGPCPVPDEGLGAGLCFLNAISHIAMPVIFVLISVALFAVFKRRAILPVCVISVGYAVAFLTDLIKYPAASVSLPIYGVRPALYGGLPFPAFYHVWFNDSAWPFFGQVNLALLLLNMVFWSLVSAALIFSARRLRPHAVASGNMQGQAGIRVHGGHARLQLLFNRATQIIGNLL